MGIAVQIIVPMVHVVAQVILIVIQMEHASAILVLDINVLEQHAVCQMVQDPAL